jgi:hypothetical protein
MNNVVQLEIYHEKEKMKRKEKKRKKSSEKFGFCSDVSLVLNED